jgi:hypothetical protein
MLTYIYKQPKPDKSGMAAAIMGIELPGGKTVGDALSEGYFGSSTGTGFEEVAKIFTDAFKAIGFGGQGGKAEIGQNLDIFNEVRKKIDAGEVDDFVDIGKSIGNLKTMMGLKNEIKKEMPNLGEKQARALTLQAMEAMEALGIKPSK